MIPAGWTLKETRRWMREEAKQYGEKFVELAVAQRTPGLLRALRNRHYLVQIYNPLPHQNGHVLVRISVNRAVLDDKGGWLDGITWDQLQAIKAAVGYGDHDALEVYPAQGDVVNVANIRHLWVLPNPLAWKWGAEHAARA